MMESVSLGAQGVVQRLGPALEALQLGLGLAYGEIRSRLLIPLTGPLVAMIGPHLDPWIARAERGDATAISLLALLLFVLFCAFYFCLIHVIARCCRGGVAGGRAAHHAFFAEEEDISTTNGIGSKGFSEKLVNEYRLTKKGNLVVDQVLWDEE